MSFNQGLSRFLSDVLTELLNDEEIGFTEVIAKQFVQRYRFRNGIPSAGLDKQQFFAVTHDVAKLMQDCFGTSMQFPVVHELNRLYEEYKKDHPIIIAKGL